MRSKDTSFSDQDCQTIPIYEFQGSWTLLSPVKPGLYLRKRKGSPRITLEYVEHTMTGLFCAESVTRKVRTLLADVWEAWWFGPIPFPLEPQ